MADKTQDAPEPPAAPVYVRNIDIPFGDLMVFGVKLAFAMVPAWLVALLLQSCGHALTSQIH